ncbi:phosphate ABC transporter substrate-binding protein, PhoT family [Syntrophus gentianae]|uniref:Phosphate-binding protein n=1 Tax=Syntrophus gentianae TaxID=43775 RepID=A0A1H7WWL0_9BACT|nr:phosphate ABC transporter substrate-binding protein [Syntrophus gentianae]SEM25318.1 phosphate ABC transporter substrate-binding protein, PhoT family [Syntrophus gentianae]
MKKVSMWVLSCLMFLVWSLPAAAATTVVIKGSTTVLPIAQVALEAYMKSHPGVNISLSGGGSGEGIKALIDRSTDIANSSREIKDKEAASAKEKGVSVKEHVVAVDAIVPIVNPRNKVNGLTLDQLSQIYQGKITNWKEVGGENIPIVVVSRDSSSGTYESWGHLVLNGAKVTPKAQLQASSGAVVQTVSKNRYAIGYIGLGYLNRSVKGLTVNGIQASAQTVLAKTYPIARPLYMYTNGQPTGEVAGFINFVLSPAGQKLVEKEGFVPVQANAKKGVKKGKK